MNRKELSIRICEAAARLERMCKLDAPEYIIEMNRVTLINKIISFPINAPAQVAYAEAGNKAETEKEDFLRVHGFYKDIEEFLDDLPEDKQ